jgi:hypothetical protein
MSIPQQYALLLTQHQIRDRPPLSAQASHILINQILLKDRANDKWVIELQARGEKLLAAPLIMFAYLLLLVIVS